MSLDLSVIVPCHNEAATLPEQLDALTAERWDGSWEIVVVDNNSTDATATIAASYAEGPVPVRIVTANDGASVGYARNAGAATSTARSIAFCDGDDVVRPGWVAAMGEALRDADLVVGTLTAEHVNAPELAATRPMGGADALPHFGPVPFARGNNAGMRRTLWADLGGFAEGYRGLEDIEFSLRAAAAGVEPVLVPDATIAYRFRTGLGDVWRQGQFYGFGRPKLAKQAASLGLPTPSRFGGLKSWVALVTTLPRLVTRPGRFGWVWILANRIGSLKGAVHARYLFV